MGNPDRAQNLAAMGQQPFDAAASANMAARTATIAAQAAQALSGGMSIGQQSAAAALIASLRFQGQQLEQQQHQQAQAQVQWPGGTMPKNPGMHSMGSASPGSWQPGGLAPGSIGSNHAAPQLSAMNATPSAAMDFSGQTAPMMTRSSHQQQQPQNLQSPNLQHQQALNAMVMQGSPGAINMGGGAMPLSTAPPQQQGSLAPPPSLVAALAASQLRKQERHPGQEPGERGTNRRQQRAGEDMMFQ